MRIGPAGPTSQPAVVTIRVTVQEAKTRPSQVLGDAERGEDVVVR